MKKRILVSGSYGTGNTGDEVILEVILNGLKNHNVCVLSHDPQYTLEKFPGIRSIETPPSFLPMRMLKDLIKLRIGNYKKRWAYIKEVRQSDLFLLGGGGLLVEIATSVLAHYIYQLRIAQYFAVKCKLICVGVGILRTPWGKKSLKQVLDNCEILSVRDEKSFEFLKQIDVEKKINIVPDPAFAYPFQSFERNKKKVGINCYPFPSNPLFWKDSNEKAQRQEDLFVVTIKELLTRGYEVSLIPLGTDIDSKYCSQISKALQKQGIEIPIFETDDYKQIATQLASCHFTISIFSPWSSLTIF